METAGDSPSMKSTSGLSICPRNCRAYADSDSTYRRWPSAKMVSKARLDLPEPDSPVNTTRLSRGRSRSTPRRLCSRAPRTTSRSATVFPSMPFPGLAPMLFGGSDSGGLAVGQAGVLRSVIVDILEDYDGAVSPGGPAQRRRLDALTITKLSVGPNGKKAYPLVNRHTRGTLLVDPAHQAHPPLDP